jgi:ABC-type sugar transport system substrate-binding protein
MAFLAAAATLAATAPGCESGDFVAPPPPSPRGDAGAGRGATAPADVFVTGSTVRSIEMVQARDQAPDDALLERSTARAQAGYDKARIHISPDDEIVGANASTRRDNPQAELVRQAVSRKPQALIVEPEDPASPDLARAVADALAAKVPVVVLGRPIAGVERKPGAAALIVVGPPSFAVSARKLVELAIRNARNAKLDPQGGAILLVPPAGDRYLNDRVAAVREALKSAKIAAVDELLIPKQTEPGAEVLQKRLKADPKPSMVFTFDFASTTASNKVATDTAEKRPFIQAGYTPDDSLSKMALAGEFAALAEFAPTRLIQRAVSLAVGAAQGRSYRDKEEVAIELHESPPSAGVPHLQAARNASMQRKSQAGSDE